MAKEARPGVTDVTGHPVIIKGADQCVYAGLLLGRDGRMVWVEGYQIQESSCDIVLNAVDVAMVGVPANPTYDDWYVSLGPTELCSVDTHIVINMTMAAWATIQAASGKKPVAVGGATPIQPLPVQPEEPAPVVVPVAVAAEEIACLALSGQPLLLK